MEVLLIGGRAGVGKSTIGWEVSRLLRSNAVAHCLIEGDNLCEVHPAPADDPTREAITEANLQAVWRNYAAVGQTRLIYTNTVSVQCADWIERAVGGAAKFFGVVLTGDDQTVFNRLRAREVGGGLEDHVQSSRRGAVWLANTTPEWVLRVPTDGKAIGDIAIAVVAQTGWLTER